LAVFVLFLMRFFLVSNLAVVLAASNAIGSCTTGLVSSLLRASRIRFRNLWWVRLFPTNLLAFREEATSSLRFTIRRPTSLATTAFSAGSGAIWRPSPRRDEP
jgi:hypothetical protein